jgi:RND family efflux transporter MFP subunit
VLLVAFRVASNLLDGTDGDRPERRAPVAIAPIERGPIAQRRTFTGALEAHASFVVAPKVAGRIQRIHVRMSDPVQRGQLLAELDDAEYLQQVAQAEADLAVARASLAEAESLSAIATREIARLEELRGSGYASQAVFETAEAERLAREAQVKVAVAQITRAESALASARIRLGYTRIHADWPDGADSGPRRVAERFLDEGDNVSANTPILRVVDIDPILAVINATERDYARLAPGQEAVLTTDAFPEETFQGSIARVAPVFRETTRQARVELLVPNPDGRLRPGMFARASLVLARNSDSTIVPLSALTRRGDSEGVFVLAGTERDRARWVPVRTGLRDGDRVEVFGEDLEGDVIVLGQQLIDDGSLVRVPEPLATDPTR